MEMDFYGRVQTGCMFAQDGCQWGLYVNVVMNLHLFKMGEFHG
jgi:hypothetical protein